MEVGNSSVFLPALVLMDLSYHLPLSMLEKTSFTAALKSLKQMEKEPTLVSQNAWSSDAFLHYLERVFHEETKKKAGSIRHPLTFYPSPAVS